MNTMVNQRSMFFSDFIREGFKIFFYRIKDYSLLALLHVVPLIFLQGFVASGFPSNDKVTNIVKIIWICVIILFQMIVSLVASMSSKLITESVVEQKPLSLTDAIKLAWAKWSRAFLTLLLTSLIILGLYLLLFIPGFIYSFYYLFILDAVALRGKDGMEALKYSKMLIEGKWWRVFWISIGIAIIYGIFNGVITFVFGKLSENPFIAIIPNAIILYVANIFGVVSTVLFLNIDFVYHRRLLRRKETAVAKKIKMAPTIEEYLNASNKSKATPSKRSTLKKVVRKVKKEKPVTKRSSQKEK